MLRTLVFCFTALVAMFATTAQASVECVILLHGLARTSSSMEPLASELRKSGYAVANIDYPSRDKPIEELATPAVERGLRSCPADYSKVHFVTHSLGGILVRYHMEYHSLPKLGRVVMLGPPNKGSQVVDNFRTVPGFKAINGPAGLQLGTEPTSIPNSLGPVDFSLGIVAGTDTFNPILSLTLPNPNDGKVSVESTRVEGMSDLIEVSHSHTFMMRADDVIDQVKHFITHGEFHRDAG